MTKNQDEIQKLYVNSEGVAVIQCPQCETSKTIKVDNFKGSRHILKVKCKCQNIFQVNLEFRKLYRKMSKIPGKYVLLPGGEQKHQMTVVDISKGGFGLQVSREHRLKNGQELQVIFNLDDKHRTLIDRRVIVKLVKDNHICCELVEGTSHDKVLGFYLMP